MAAGFGNYLDAAFNSGAQQPRALVVTEGFAGDGFLYSSNAFEHVVNAQQRRAGSHLEDSRCLGLDLFTNQRVEPFARGEVHLDAKALFQ